ncbi:MAG TPA: DUF3291 domain-containing protein [Micromonosporaceae bacterium]|nr:DUF3291 domain-containing protein [Micromonosporaceae bacterium]
MPTYHLAQLNVALPLAPLDDPVMAGFVDGLERLNALADGAPGFVWRLVDSNGQDATGLRLSEERSDTMVNLSVWESLDALRDYVYRTAHLDWVRRRRDWFRHAPGPYQVLWWVPAGHLPALAEAAERLALLVAEGPGPDAFTFREAFPAPAGPVPSVRAPSRAGQP